MRRSIADFLFNYKISQQYPHEFSPYDLSQSADSLNTALSPLVEAFNRDLAAYQIYLRAAVNFEVDALNDQTRRTLFRRMFGSDKPAFYNDGVVTVRTVSGKYTTVDTTTQSYLDASVAPSVSDLANAITGAPTGSSSGASGSNAVGVLGSLTPVQTQVLMGALKAYQSSQVQIGRGLSLHIQPRSLSGASSAEIDVLLNADESAAPTYYGGSQNGSQASISRVANHDTTTRVRVESIKLFEVSSLAAVLQRSRPRFPLLPPFVELPYIGTIAGIPLPATKEYHNSTAVLSAIVVPTAADLAYGLSFVADQILEPNAAGGCQLPGMGMARVPTCRTRRAASLRDFPDQPIQEYHKAMMRCMATGQPYPGIAPAAVFGCGGLTFGYVLQNPRE